jgi:hypothetical protein
MVGSFSITPRSVTDDLLIILQLRLLGNLLALSEPWGRWVGYSAAVQGRKKIDAVCGTSAY